MDSLLPTISVSDLQRHPRRTLESIENYAVVRSHQQDLGLILHPRLGKALLQSGEMRQLLELASPISGASAADVNRLIGKVVRELSKK
ncbi:MAG: hypothetical protein PHS73_03190 [Candidatus Peribacteraceae bacterium]|nr:hypothetical protein [Candidatus Peribacteraceae bacterium]